MNEIQDRLNYVSAIADWFLDQGEDHIASGKFEDALKCTYVAGTILGQQNRDLSSVRLEAQLRRISQTLLKEGIFRDSPQETSGRSLSSRRKRCLHVLDEALPAGGSTAMACRWIKNDTSGCAHSVALLDQRVPVPASLCHAVDASGGKLHLVDASQSLVSKTAWLRTLAMAETDHVVLHVEPADVVSSVAFGISGGPPVMLVNHAAHLYWSGASTADHVVNCRGSELEVFWSAAFRGVGSGRCSIVPIPLPDPGGQISPTSSRSEIRESTRRALGLAPDAVVVLTVGSAFKYLPTGELDFLRTWERILQDVPHAVLLAVGFIGDERWQEAAGRLRGRIRTLGAIPHARLLEIQDVADLYVEAFPFGTTTSLLEAGIKGLPVALAPYEVPPPYATDGIAIDHVLHRPASIREYEANMKRICRSAEERSIWGAGLRESIMRHHSGTGWQRHLDAAIAALPAEHQVHHTIAPTRTPAAVHELWSRMARQWSLGDESALEVAVTRALTLGLRPRMTPTLLQTCRSHASWRWKSAIPLPLLTVLLKIVLPRLSIAGACTVFRISTFLFRRSLAKRISNKLRVILGNSRRRDGPYEEYRRMRDEQDATTPVAGRP